MQDKAKTKRLLMDAALIAALLLIALGLYLFLNRAKGADTADDEGPWAVVMMDGEETARYSMAKNGTYVLNGGTNTLVIEDGYAWMTDSQCPDKICEYMGKIRYNGQLIVCLPNGVIVTVEGGEDGGVDIFG